MDDRDLPPELDHDDPVVLARRWFDDARLADAELQPDATVLATVGDDGRPSARAVLVRSVDDDGLVFYTNRSSRKGRDLAANPMAALCSTWHSLHRQLRVEGPVHAADDATSDAYWRQRALGSRLSAAASPQSQPVASRAELERLVEDVRAAHPGGPPRPDHWGGYVVVPDSIEFWLGRPDRLHDRVLFTRAGPAGGWRRTRLAP